MGDIPGQNSEQSLDTNLNTNQDTNVTIPEDNIFSDNTDTSINQPINIESPTTLPNQKKSKGPFIILILVLLVILGLAGYFVYDKYIRKDESKPTAVTPSQNVEKKVLLKDANQSVVYSDVDEMHEGKVKRIPYINIESSYADQINKEIKELTKNGLDGQITDQYYGIDYQYYVNDEIVSVKFTWETETNQTVSRIYNINQYTGEKVSNSEILKYVSINENELNNKLVESYKIARPYDSIENKEIWKDNYQTDLDTLSSGKIKAMYLNNKELYVLFDLSYPAGSGIGEVILNVSSNKFIQNPFTLK